MRRRHGQRVVLTGEDLCNLGPVALLQDLAMMALLGIEHVERNGHHYYRGLSMWPADWQDAVLAAHADIYTRHANGFAASGSSKADCQLNVREPRPDVFARIQPHAGGRDRQLSNPTLPK